MLKSEIRTRNGTPRLYIEGKETTAVAYTTYFEERSAYLDFLIFVLYNITVYLFKGAVL